MIQLMRKRLYPERMESPLECPAFTAENIGGNLFLAIDDRLALSVSDLDPIDTDAFGLVGFEAFYTKVKYGNIRVKRLERVDDWKTYTPEL